MEVNTLPSLPKVESNVPGCAKDNEAVKIEISNTSKMTVFIAAFLFFELAFKKIGY